MGIKYTGVKKRVVMGQIAIAGVAQQNLVLYTAVEDEYFIGGHYTITLGGLAVAGSITWAINKGANATAVPIEDCATGLTLIRENSKNIIAIGNFQGGGVAQSQLDKGVTKKKAKLFAGDTLVFSTHSDNAGLGKVNITITFYVAEDAQRTYRKRK